MKLVNKTKGVVLAEEVIVANSFFARLSGLLRYPRLKPHQALLLIPSNSIHTFFMRYAIAVIFLDKERRVVAFYSCLKPWRLSRIYFNSYYVVELLCRRELVLSRGDILTWEE